MRRRVCLFSAVTRNLDLTIRAIRQTNYRSNAQTKLEQEKVTKQLKRSKKIKGHPPFTEDVAALTLQTAALDN